MRTTILLYIEKLRLDIKNSLKEDEQNYELISKLLELNRIEREILLMSKHPEILNSTFYRILETATDNSEIRLMDDCDTENMSYWVETEVGGERIRLKGGDIILTIK